MDTYKKHKKIKAFKIYSDAVYTSATDAVGSYALVAGYQMEFLLYLYKNVGYLIIKNKARPTGTYKYINVHMNLEKTGIVHCVKRFALNGTHVATCRIGTMATFGYTYTSTYPNLYIQWYNLGYNAETYLHGL